MSQGNLVNGFDARGNVMIIVIAALVLTTMIHAVLQGWLMKFFRQLYSTPQTSWPTEVPLPKAAIVLCLRGNDPYLDTCLSNLVNQDYPDYLIEIVVDSENDPAWESVRSIQNQHGESSLRVSVLRDRRSTCGLKNSAILQAIQQLPADIDVVAFVDADAITYPNWLRDLVTPLADPKVGGSTGIRWFAPIDATFSARVRCHWGTLAAPVMYFSRTPWGGSMLIRRSILDTGLTDEWSRMLCEDVHTSSYLKQHCWKLSFVPQVTIVNQEGITASGCVRFSIRQMLFFRLYQAYWWLLAGLIATATIPILFHIYFLCQAVLQQQWWAVLALCLIRGIVFFVTRHESIQLDRVIRETVQKTGRSVNSTPTLTPIGYFFTELLLLVSVAAVFFPRSLNWRGIKYRIYGPSSIQLIEYQPFFEAHVQVDSNQSTVI